MTSPERSQSWLECKCSNCRRQIRFKSSEAGYMAPCPFCKNNTLLKVEPLSQTKIKTVKLPQWVLPAVSLLCIAIILTVLAYQFMANMGLGMVGTWLLVVYLAVWFLMLGIWVLTISFCVYIFNWLREMRPVIKQIEVNTRRSGPSEYRTASAEIASPKQSTSAEDMKYMPKI